MSSYKQQTTEALLSLQAEVNQTLELLANVDDKSPIKAEILVKRDEIAKELETRKADMAIAGLNEVFDKFAKKYFTGKEGVTVLAVFTVGEDGVVSGKLEAPKRAKSASAGTGTGAPRVGGGGKQPVRVTLLSGETFEASSGAEAMETLRAKKVVPADYGIGDSAIRSLKSILGKNMITSFEVLPKEEKKADAPAPAEAPAA